MKLLHGNCLDVMATLDAESVDSIVTDPPYGLSFMGRDWDHGVPGEAFWLEALRVAKPGAHLLAFGGSRTYHRLACAIEDAGWEIRDCIMWVYGSGFPKSHDVSKAIDKAAGAEREVVNIAGRSKLGGGDIATTGMSGGDYFITAPATDAAKQWQGWGTALKPAYEPIIVARKPLIGTVAANVQQYGTGAINVDGCRIASDDGYTENAVTQGVNTAQTSYAPASVRRTFEPSQSGRWPANFIHDGSDEVVGLFPVTGASKATPRNNGEFKSVAKGRDLPHITYGHDDNGGSAARFFYCAKASKRDRDEGCEGMEEREKNTRNSYGDQSSYECPDGANRLGNKGTSLARNHHPTVKPTDLMRYLCRLVTPPGGTVLDPFMGSGSTGKGATLEGFDFIGIEQNAEYLEIAKARIQHAIDSASEKLFSDSV